MTAFLPSLRCIFSRKTRLLTAAALAFVGISPLFSSGAVQAYESHYIPKADGSLLFELRYFDKGAQYYMPDENDDYISTWTLSEKQKNSVIEAVRLWADALDTTSRNTSPLVINIGTFDDNNAAAVSAPNDSNLPVVVTGLQGGLISSTAMDYPAAIVIGPMDFAYADHLSPIPLTGKNDFTGIIYHEMGHALGVFSLHRIIMTSVP